MFIALAWHFLLLMTIWIMFYIYLRKTGINIHIGVFHVLSLRPWDGTGILFVCYIWHCGPPHPMDDNYSNRDHTPWKQVHVDH